ncbi:MAG TPA: hypothetical protein VFX49_22055 [Chloroflexota bacterium]|nr:hypothetical protein [Chloroflexota bacterium]
MVVDTSALPDGTALLAGTARVVITPPVGIHLTGFAGRAPSTGVHDDLTATALLLAERDPSGAARDDTRVAVVALDLLYMPGDTLVPAIKAQVERATGIPSDRVLLCCSHTHYGPVLNGRQEGGEEPIAVAYHQALAHQIAGVILAASQNLRPVTLAVGRGSVKVGINRRELRDGRIVLGQNPPGTLDSEVLVWRFDAAGGPDVTPGAPAGWVRRSPETVATIVNYACHPVSLTSSTRHVSADYPGVMRGVVEKLVGGTCLFLQGAAGNINPSLMIAEWDVPRRLGHALGAEATRALLLAEPVAAAPLRFARQAAGLPALTPPSIDAGRARVAELEQDRSRILSQNPPNAGRLWWVDTVLERTRKGLDALESGRPLPPVDATFAALRLGDTALVTNPSELFCEIGMAIKQGSPFAHTAVVGYTDGAVGYIPTRAAYPEGGYEVERACRVNPEAGELLQETSLCLLGSLRDG